VVSEKSMVGSYFYQSKRNSEFSSSIKLNDDLSFAYRSTESIVPDPIIRGKWKVTGSKLILVPDDPSSIRKGWRIWKARKNSVLESTRNGYRKLVRLKTHYTLGFN